jgi:hypothetical protein
MYGRAKEKEKMRMKDEESKERISPSILTGFSY